MQTTLEPPSLQNLPFEAPAVDRQISQPLRRGGGIAPQTDLQKVWRLYVLGGITSLGIGTAAMQAYGVSTAEAASAVGAWLMLTYVAGRTVVGLINSLVDEIPEAPPKDYPAWLPWAAGTMLVGFVCEFAATTMAMAALIYSALPLTWAIHPALVLCGITASLGFGLVIAAVFWVCLQSGLLRLLLLVVEYELLKVSVFIGVCGGSYHAVQVAHARPRRR